MSRYDELTQRHRELIAAVNNARTENEHRRAAAYLRGWREGLDDGDTSMGGGWMKRLNWTDADLHHEGDNAQRPMCIGIFLDWKPQP
jgi:hypothetical protein